MTDAMQEWPFFRELSKLPSAAAKARRFAALAPEREIQYSRLSRANGTFTFGDGLRQRFDVERMPLARFADCLEDSWRRAASETLYMQAQSMPEAREHLPELFGLHGDAPHHGPSFWLGNGAQSTALHNDRFSNFIAMFVGRKRVFLFPPGALSNLYVAPIDKRIQGALTSLVDPRNPDLLEYPRFRVALQEMRIAEVSEGEILHIPALWWHLVESDGPNLSANFWAQDVPHASGLYEPQSLSLLEADAIRQTAQIRYSLARTFGSVLNGGDVRTDSQLPLVRRVIDCALCEREELVRIDDQRKRLCWAEWIEALANWLVFQVDGAPFPTLPGGEFERMVADLRSNGYFRRDAGSQGG